MLRLFRRPPREGFELDTEDAAPPVGGEEVEPDAEGELGSSTGPRQHPLKPILAFGVVAVGLGALYLGWSGGRSDEPVPPRLLPQGRASLTQEGPRVQGAPVTSAPTSSPSTAPASPSAQGSTTAPQAQTPTFYLPLQPDPREVSQVAAGQVSSVPTGGPYTVLVQASHEATVENLRAQIAELKLKTLRAELEADQLRKNPRRVFKEDRPAAEPKKEPSALERLARVPPPMLPMPGPIPADRQAQVSAAPPAAPPAPPQMRVRMVTLEPKEALIEAGDAESRGWFKVHEGQKFPDFVITTIGEDGVTISFGGRGFFYPVGGSALGVPPDTRQAASRQTSDPARR